MQLYPPLKPPYTIIHKFGDQMNYGKHLGMDFAKFKDPSKPFSYGNVLEDWPVLYPTNGTIIEKRWSTSGGNILTIDIGEGFRVWLAHFKQTFNPVGTKVKRGDTAGIAGTTPGLPWSDYVHCHLQLYKDGIIIDPEPYLIINEKLMKYERIRDKFIKKFTDYNEPKVIPYITKKPDGTSQFNLIRKTDTGEIIEKQNIPLSEFVGNMSIWD